MHVSNPHIVLGGFTLLVAVATSCRKDLVDRPVPPPTSRVIGDKMYPTVMIGKWVWTTANYTGPGGIAHSSDAQKAAIYDRYYTYAEAKAIAPPAGWHLPTEQDGKVLLQSQGIVLEADQSTAAALKYLLSTTHWRTTPGTNASGFNAYPTGYSSQNKPPQDGDRAELWLANGESMSIQEATNGQHRLRFYGSDADPTVRYTVRFVRYKRFAINSQL